MSSRNHRTDMHYVMKTWYIIKQRKQILVRFIGPVALHINTGTLNC